jgi:hypothetical protein
MKRIQEIQYTVCFNKLLPLPILTTYLGSTDRRAGRVSRGSDGKIELYTCMLQHGTSFFQGKIIITPWENHCKGFLQ